MSRRTTVLRLGSRRLAAVGAAAAAVLAVTATGAAATPATSGPTSYEGATTSTALDLSVLAGVPGGLGSVTGIDTSDGVISLPLLAAESSLIHDATGQNPDAASSAVTLIGGTVASLAQQAGDGDKIPTASSSLAHPGPDTSSGLLDLPSPLDVAPLTSISTGSLTAQSAADPLSTSSAGVGVDLTALKLSDLVPASNLSSFTTGYQTLLGQLGDLQSLVALLATVPGLTDVDSTAAALAQDLSDLQTQAQTDYDDITGGAVAAVNGLKSSSSIATVGSQEVSTSHVELGTVTLLGGFGSVTGFSNTATAKAGGTPGSASFTPDITNGGTGALTLAGGSAGLDGSGVTADFGPLQTAIDAVSQGTDFATALSGVITNLQSALAQLNTGLSGLLSVTADTASNVSVAADGTSASGDIDGLSVAVTLPDLGSLPSLGTLPEPPDALTPPPVELPESVRAFDARTAAGSSAHAAADPTATQVLDLTVGATSAAAAALVATPAAAAAATPPATPTAELAYTGADLPLTGGVATLLIVVGAAAVRRRRSRGAAADEI